MRKLLLTKLLIGFMMGTLAALRLAGAPASTGASMSPQPKAPTGLTNGPANTRLANGESGLRLNFRGVPLEMVLSYLSRAAGLIINLETTINGKVDVWSEQPLSLDEAINLLDSVLNRNGYAALRQERTLTIVTRDNARKKDLPVKVGNKPEDIPKVDRMVTQIIPIRNANAATLTKDLQPLLPEFAILTANESANALVLTDLQSDIRRMVEIVKALDTSISAITKIRVFPLRFADAKDLATELKDLFPSSNSNNSGRGGSTGGGMPTPMMLGGGLGGGPGGGGFGFGPGGAGTAGGLANTSGGGAASEARQAASRITTVADERTNSLIVSAPEELLATIAQVVKEIDSNAENITVMRSFQLKFADPIEIENLLGNLFPDDSRSDGNRSTLQFGGGGPGGFGGGPVGGGAMGGTQPSASNRSRLKNQVMAVADPRTSSIIVSASSDLMPKIEQMISQLDANPARKQKVFVYSLKNGNVNNVQLVLQDMFASTSQNRNSSQQNNDALATRQSQGAQVAGQSLMQQTTSTGGRNAFGGTGQ